MDTKPPHLKKPLQQKQNSTATTKLASKTKTLAWKLPQKTCYSKTPNSQAYPHTAAAHQNNLTYHTKPTQQQNNRAPNQKTDPAASKTPSQALHSTKKQ
jgi:hypothetical protein